MSPRYACTCLVENHLAKWVPKLNVHENFGSFYCFANAEENYLHKWGELCIQEGVDHPGFLELKSRNGPKGCCTGEWIVGCVVIQQWEGIYIFCLRKQEMVVLLGLNPWEKCASFKGKKQKGSWRDEVQWVSYNMKPERKICMTSIYVSAHADWGRNTLKFHLNICLLLCMRQSFENEKDNIKL